MPNIYADTQRFPGDWATRHNRAVDAHKHGGSTQGAAIVRIALALDTMACAHFRMYATPICDEGVLGPAWLDMVRGLRAQLNGETGPSLDCGTLDGFLCDLAREHGHEGEL